MDYKLLYGLIFLPLVIAIIYMVFFANFPKKTNPQNHKTVNIETMLPLARNFEQINRDHFSHLLQQDDTVLIDIRTSEEQETYGIIAEDQLHIEFGTETFAEEILKLDKNQKYLVYCWHGQRSAVAREFMQENGFTWVKDLKGGIDAWKD